MGVKIGTTDIVNVAAGSTGIKSIYAGTTEIWQDIYEVDTGWLNPTYISSNGFNITPQDPSFAFDGNQNTYFWGNSGSASIQTASSVGHGTPLPPQTIEIVAWGMQFKGADGAADMEGSVNVLSSINGLVVPGGSPSVNLKSSGTLDTYGPSADDWANNINSSGNPQLFCGTDPDVLAWWKDGPKFTTYVQDYNLAASSKVYLVQYRVIYKRTST